ncbi:MAG TPA: respiratory nitrate reductase subunit gamma [Gaiellaceae bacterium]|nr:respiratory nitrate reductase subunit gamma [Gaiellaceae bacterium]
MSSADLFLWIALPYICLAIFVVGHVSRYRRDQLTWTARSTQLLEQRLLRVGSLLFHFGVLAVIGGHVLGILIPAGVTSALGISEHVYHLISIVAGGSAGAAMTIGFAILLYRRAAVPRVRVTTSRGDLVMYPLLTIALVTGMLATFGENLFSPYHYRETVSPWFRGIFGFRPHTEEMAGAPFIFQLHATCVWLLYAVWPFSRLVHAWSIPLSYLQRSWILYRSRNPRAALAFERSRVSQERAQP